MIDFPPVISARLLLLFIVAHFLACAFAWNPKTNEFVLELSISTFVVCYCAIGTVLWYFLFLSTSTAHEGWLIYLQGFMGKPGEVASISMVIVWASVFANFLWNHEFPRRRRFFGALTALVLSGVLLALTVRIPIAVESLYNSQFPTP